MYFIYAIAPKKRHLFYNDTIKDFVEEEEKATVFSSRTIVDLVYFEMCKKYAKYNYRILIPNATENFPKTKEAII